MAEMGDGYGSECHLLRYLGRHRSLFNQEVNSAISGQDLEWLDYPFDPTRTWRDGEWKGLDFLPEDDPARAAWWQVWPQRGNPPNWDAVGTVVSAGTREWLLVEAKANCQELRSSCQASESGGRALINATLRQTKQALGVSVDRDWLNGHYQFCDRIAVLHHLVRHGTPARLLNIYFVGDRGDERRTCPTHREAWSSSLEAMKGPAVFGLPSVHPLSQRMHELFIEVCPGSSEGRQDRRAVLS